MSDAVPPPETGIPQRPKGRKRRFAWRWTRRLTTVLVAVLAAIFVSVFTIDLGRFPIIREVAESRGSAYLRRPLHIGSIAATLVPGKFVLKNVTIDGPHAGDRPFFHADRIDVYLAWLSMIRLSGRELTVEVRLNDWNMTIEQWADGAHLPHLTPDSTSSGPKRWTTTVSVFANGGTFTYDDHTTPWSVVAPNLQFSLVHSDVLHTYLGNARFSQGTVKIQSYLPMRTDLTTRFELDGPRVTLQHIDLVTDGAVTHVGGNIDFAHWPNQTYNIDSTIDFATMKKIFFANESWRLGGAGQFQGVFRLFSGGHELAGRFSSEDAGVNGLDFDHLDGALVWNNNRFDVTHADASLLGGNTRFTFGIAPLGTRTGSIATFAADYDTLDLVELNRLVDLKALHFVGRASGDLDISWPTGKFGTEREGRGHTDIQAPFGLPLAMAELPAVPEPIVPEPKPFASNRVLPPVALGADLRYTFDATGFTFDESSAATPFTYVRFSGRMASTGDSNFPFHVTSHDWQESDRLLSAIMTAVSGPTGGIEIGGRGTFDGAMTGTFSAPRIAGHFAGDRTKVWDVTWGRAEGDAVIEHGFVTIPSSRIGDRPESSITAEGRFALGFRDAEPEEINAKVNIANWPAADLKHAFGLDDWAMTGTIGTASLTLTGKYKNMFGTGHVRIDQGSAWGEHFEAADGDVDLEGTGMRVHRLSIKKGPGTVLGDARVGWDGTYSFTANGQGVPVDQLDNFRSAKVPLTGQLNFTASGAGDFDHPAYVFRGSIDDLYLGDQGIGQVVGQLHVQDKTLALEQVSVRSSLLNVDGHGTVDFDETTNTSLHFRFTESSIDPYVKYLAPQFSSYTRAVLSGAVDMDGPMSTPEKMTVDASVDTARLRLFDYDLTNDGPIHLSLQNGAYTIGSLKLQGADTNLELKGGADANHRTLALGADGNANLAILKAFFPTLQAEGAATVHAALGGSFDAPELSGNASLTDGRLRPLGSVHSLTELNGSFNFDKTGVHVDHLTGSIGSGDVTFGGYISVDGYKLTEYQLTADGRAMRLRYPTGFNTTADMQLRLTGPIDAPKLTGNVGVLRVDYLRDIDPESGIFGLAGGGSSSAVAVGGPEPEASGIPLALDIGVSSPRTALINNKQATIEGTVNLHLGGTFDRPQILGDITIANGTIVLLGNRYFVRQGSIDFNNPNRLDPVFDLTAETRPRLAGESFDITAHISGTFSKFNYNFSSEPSLPVTDIAQLLIGGSPDSRTFGTQEQRALASSQQSQQQLIQMVGAMLLTAPLSSRIGSVFERALPFVDTVQVVPYFPNENAFQNPGARVTVGRRLSPRIYVTYSRTLTNTTTIGSTDQILLIEYDQSDRISWVLSRNEDGSFSLDYRIRYEF